MDAQIAGRYLAAPKGKNDVSIRLPNTVMQASVERKFGNGYARARGGMT